MSYQLEVLQTCINSFMMGLINNKSIPRKLMKKCQIFDYLCKKFPLDQSQLENYSKNIAFNSSQEVEKKFLQQNLLDFLVFNKCGSMESSSVQFSNSASTTVLDDSSVDCISPGLARIKNINKDSNNPYGLGQNEKDYYLPSLKTITGLQDQSSFSSGTNSYSLTSATQLNATLPASVQYEQKIETSSKPPIAPIYNNMNNNNGIMSVQQGKMNEQNIILPTSTHSTQNKKTPILSNFQSPSQNIPPTANNNHYYSNNVQHFQSTQTPTAIKNNPITLQNQESIKVNQFTFESNHKSNNNNPIISTQPSTHNNNHHHHNNNNNDIKNKQINNNFYYPMCIKPINFKMTMSNNKDFSNSVNCFENNTISNNMNIQNNKQNQQFNNTLNRIQQQDLNLKQQSSSSSNGNNSNNNTIPEKVNTYNPSNLLSKLKETMSSFKEDTVKIHTLIQNSSVTQSIAGHHMMDSQRAQQHQQQQINLMASNKNVNIQPTQMYQQQIDNKRKSYMLKNMSIYQQNNTSFRKLQV